LQREGKKREGIKRLIVGSSYMICVGTWGGFMLGEYTWITGCGAVITSN
jgi:hypothetical protein